MRVTQNTNYETVRESLRKSRGRMENLQTQHATLKKVNTPSDDPVGAAKILGIRTEKVNNEQFITNAKLAETLLQNTDHGLGELADLVARAKEIALGQSSGASSNEYTRIGVAEEVGHLYKQAVAVANKRIGDRYIFGGYKSDKPPVDADGRYQGDDGQVMVEIGKDVFLTANIHGLEAFNSVPEAAREPSATQRYGIEHDATHRIPASLELKAGEDRPMPENVNVFDELQGLRIGLLTGDIELIRTTLERFDQIHAKLIATRAKVGSRMQGLQSTTVANEKHNITNAQLGTVLEDADMAQVVADLAKEETVFRSALQSSQKLIQPTLLDFLK